MQNKQVNEIATILEVGAKISNVRLIKGFRSDKDGWNLVFDYETVSGVNSCMLISQHKKPRFWVSLETACKDIRNIFPEVKEVLIRF